MTATKVPPYLSKVNPEYIHPRGTWPELNRPFAELQAEAEARRASWFQSDDKPKTARVFVVPVIETSFVENLMRAIETLDNNLANLQRRLVIDDRPYKTLDAWIGRYARSA